MLSSEGTFSTIAHPLGALYPSEPNSVLSVLSDPLTAPLSFNSSASAIAFVDGGLSNYQTLVEGVSPGTAVYVLNPNGDELSQIGQVLADYSNLSSVSVFSHGKNGALQLGHQQIDSDALTGLAGVFQSWSGAFSEQGDLLLYGCDMAADATGQSFVSQIATLTGADVAASTDLTGSSAQGGNWTLEFSTDKIEAATPLSDWAQAAYQNVLATYTVTTTADSGSGSLRDAITQANANTGADTITFDPTTFSGVQTIRLASTLPIITDDLTITGTGTNNLFLSGDANGSGSNDAGDVQIVFINQGTVNISNLTFTNGRGKGGDGGNGSNTSNDFGGTGGGGGGGMGGAIFVNDGNVLINSVAFSNNAAIGGSGGTTNSPNGVFFKDTGGGGGGFSGDGGDGTPTTPGAGGAGSSAIAGSSGGNGGSNDFGATNGGFGGGGGGSIFVGSGGDGGFGGGGGGSGLGIGGSGGFGGGSSGYSGGGGGAGLGGAIFIRSGDVTLLNTSFTSNTAIGGAGGILYGVDGQGIGGAIFAVTQDLAAQAGIATAPTVKGSNVTFSNNTAANSSNDIFGSITLLLNQPPVANNDSFTISEDTTLTVSAANGVLANDTDADNNALSAILVTGPTKGSLTLNTNGSFTYTPNLNFDGTDSFTYRADDGTVNSNNIATVTLNVTAVNDAPVLTGTPANLPAGTEDTPYTITVANLLTGFTDVDSPTLSVSDVKVNGVALTTNAAGDYVFNPPTNANGQFTVTYNVTDGLASVPASLNFTLAAVNDAPTIAAPTSVNVQSGVTAISGISISDVDAGTGTLTTTLSVANGSLNLTNLNGATASGLNTGTVTLNGTQAQINAALATLRYGGGTFSGNTNLTVSVNDNGNAGSGGALTATQTIALSVAQNVGTLGNSAVNVTGTVNGTDAIDRYQFTLGSRTTSFRLTLGDLTSNADVFILNSSGVVMASSTNTGTRADVINNVTLDAGTYFIEVRRVSGSTGYNLSFRR